MTKKVFSFVIFFSFLMFYNISGQNFDRSITITKTYEPVFSTKEKIDEKPEIYDTTKIKPVFNYIILPIKVDASYSPNEIKPAKISAIPVDKVYSNFFKIGLGNYLSPELIYQFSSLRARDYSYGLNISHLSSTSKITLENKHKINAGYYDNIIEAYGTKLIDFIKLDGNVFLKGNAINYYGYNTNLFIDSIPDINKQSIKQVYNEIGIKLSLEKQCSDLDKFGYSFRPFYSYFYDKYKNNQHSLSINGNLFVKLNNKLLDFKIFTNYNYYNTSFDTAKTWIVSFIPSITKKEEKYEYDAGFLLSLGSDDELSKFYFAPKLRFMLRMAEDYFNPYIGIDGFIKSNTYKDLAIINPYIVPGFKSLLSEFLVFYGGIKGLLYSKWGYDLSTSYSYHNNMTLFVKDTIGKLQNQFIVVNDNINKTELSLISYFYPTKNLKFELEGIYRYILLEKEKYAWHLPNYEIKSKFSLLIKSKIMTKLSFNYFDSRYSKIAGDTNYYKLPSIIDLNLNLEYYHSKILTFYFNIYNIASSKYQIWYQYPVQRLNFIVGLTYKL